MKDPENAREGVGAGNRPSSSCRDSMHSRGTISVKKTRVLGTTMRATTVPLRQPPWGLRPGLVHSDL